MQKHIAIIDPVVESPANHCFNQIASLSSADLQYYLPAFNQSDVNIQFDGLQGVMLLGSYANVDQNKGWQKPLIKTVQKIIDRGIPLLAICYGHQLIAHMFGATVEQPAAVTEKIVGLKQVQWQQKPVWLQEADPFWMAASHYQQVINVPDGFELAASRNDCPIESLVHKSKPIWTTQCHPEASPEFARKRDMTDGLDRLEHGWSLIKDFLVHCLS